MATLNEDLLYNTSITENERNVIQAVMKRGTILHSATPALWSITPTFSDAYPTATLSDSDFTFDSIESAILSLKAGNFILVVDNEDRENEGDLIIAAEDLTEEKAAFMIRYTSGVLCVPAVEERLKDLELPLMVEQNKDSFKTAYTITVDHKDTTTGISAADRARTVRALSDPSEPASNFNRPGHVFPLRYTPGGVLKRIGHTEASVDLCKLAGKRPVAAISEVILDTGSMARRNDLIPFARKWGIKLVTIADLVAYRLKHGLVEL